MLEFRQTTSFIERLRMVLIIIAAFFVFGIMGLYLSSRGFLLGMKDLAQVNRILSFTNMTSQALSASEENFDKFELEGLSDTRMILFREASQFAIAHLQDGIHESGRHPRVRSKLTNVQQAVNLYLSTVNDLYARKNRSRIDMKSELLIAHQYVMDAEDGLREAQLLLKRASDRTFSELYEKRFYPFVVAGLLSSAFFAFVVLVGISNAKRLGGTLRNLNRATDAVASGDFEYESPILEEDEFGRLTFAFNSMVRSLKENRGKLTETVDKVNRLQRITNSFSGALLPNEVFDVIELEVYKALKADAGAISLLNEEGTMVENRVTGYRFTQTNVGLDWPSPAMEALRSAKPIFIEKVDELEETYPFIHNLFVQNKIVSVCYLPLVAGNQIYGILNFGFRTPRDFADEDREFMLALTAQSAQAFHRAKLFKSATDAIRVRDEFLSIASHELRTPLTPLKLQLQNMSRQVRKGNIQLPNQDLVLKMVDNSDRQVDRLITLIDDLLDVSRISAGRLTLNFETFNLGEMVEEVVAQYSQHLKSSRISMEIDKTVSCFADKVRMEQVLINLLTNAVKYAPGKPVHVKLSHVDGKARMEVRDEGDGISEENQKRIFDRFERVRDKNNIGGLGLGLYICRQIVEAHKGTIHVSSKLGEGASFIVEIPAVS